MIKFFKKGIFFLLKKYFKYFVFTLLPVFSNSLLAKQVELRATPYPHSHIVSFASDTDGQVPDWEAAFHHFANETLGLSISDSLWVHGGLPYHCMLFKGPNELNRTPSEVNGHAVYGLLIRQWHRGNIDHFHSWQNDSVFRIKNEFPNEIKLDSSVVGVDIPEVVLDVKGTPYHNLRLFFDKTPPSDLSITLIDDQNQKVTITASAVLDARNAFPKDNMYSIEGTAIDLIITPNFHKGVIFSSENFKLSALKKITLYSSTCKDGCNVTLQRVERDNFSRQTVQRQNEFLQQWNIAPNFLSAHGGYTYSQNPAIALDFKEFPRQEGTIWQHDQIDRTIKPGAVDFNSHAFHADILYKLGVKAMWTIDASYDAETLNDKKTFHEHPFLDKFPQAQFYLITRSALPTLNVETAESYVDSLKKIEPEFKEKDLRESYLGNTIYSQPQQGGGLGLLTNLSLTQIEGQKARVDHFWYLHFGTLFYVPDIKLTVERPLTPSIESWLRKLANYYYNFDGSVPLTHRAWVPPASLYVHYRIMQRELPGHMTISTNDESTIRIQSWISPVTGRLMCDKLSGTRDLHGVTFYVTDPEKTLIEIEGQPITVFTKNPPDSTRKSSVTIVDDSTPTILLGKVLLTKAGTVEPFGVNFSDIKNQDNERQLSKLVAMQNGKVFIKYTPKQLDLWNITHLYVELKKNEKIKDTGRLFIEFVMEDNQKILVEERYEGQGEQLPSEIQAGWIIKKMVGAKKLHTGTFAVDQLKWHPESIALISKGGKPALPIGRVKEMYIGMKEANQGEQLFVGRIMAFRPNMSVHDVNGGKLVMGRVMQNAKIPVANCLVSLTAQGNVLTTVTDVDGYYAFYKIPKGLVVSPFIMLNGQKITPRQGEQIEIAKDEAEIDFDI